MLQVNYTEALNISVCVSALLSSLLSAPLSLHWGREEMVCPPISDICFSCHSFGGLSLIWRQITHFNPKVT